MTTIKLKNGSGAPTSGDLAQGEPALDLTNKRLYTEDSGGTVIEVGTNPGVDVTFADNRKAVFGAGSDLQIYHDGTHSRVVDAGTGNLNLQGDNLRLKTADAVGTYLEANNGGAVTITYNSSPKLATTNTGIDVTGSISADGLTVGDNEFFLAGAGGDLKIGHDGTDNIIRSQGPSLYIDANNHIFRGYSPYTEHMRIDSSGLVAIGTSSPVSTAQLTVGGTSRIAPVSGNGLLLASGGSDRMFISTAGNVGIGTSSPTQTLHLKSADPVIRLEDSSPDGVYAQIDGAGGGLILSADGGNGSASSFIGFRVDGTASGSEKMRIDSSGNVGIGVTSLVTGSSRRILQVSTGSDGGQIAFADSTTEAANPRIFATNKSDLKLASANSGASTIQFITGTTTPAERMRIDSSGNVGIGTSSPDTMLHLSDTAGGAVIRLERNDTTIANTDVYGEIQFEGQDASAGSAAGIRGKILGVAEGVTGEMALAFQTASGYSSSTERMRIDSSGNVGIGTSSPDGTLHVKDAVAQVYIQSNDGQPAQIVFGDVSDASRGRINYDSSDNIIFENNNLSERMRIDSSGNLLVGTTSGSGHKIRCVATGSDRNLLMQCANGGANAITLNTSGTADYTAFLFTTDGGNTQSGSIVVGASATAYNTSSDQRLKENIVDAPSASDDIDAIQVRSFDWKADGSHQKYGMVAQELQSVAPEAVSAPEDPEEMMGVDYSKLVPMMLKEIQSLRARVAQLETN